ncbi:hypothetical protein HDU92_005627 [Lobulomyces angularis]|nr:hypothetical protein HDU92_005627 [Lobulomyces angularis]
MNFRVMQGKDHFFFNAFPVQIKSEQLSRRNLDENKSSASYHAVAPFEESDTVEDNEKKVDGAQYAIIYFLPNSDSAFEVSTLTSSLCNSIRFLFQNFNNDAKYPVYIFMENFTKDSKANVLLDLTYETSSNGEIMQMDLIKFFPIDVNYPKELNKFKDAIIPIYKKDHPRQNHLNLISFSSLLMNPILDGVEFVLHLGYNISITSPLKYDPFEVMKASDYKYGYRAQSFAKYDEITLLWDFAEQRFDQEGQVQFAKNGFKVPEKKKKMTASILTYDTRMELLHLPTFRTVLNSEFKSEIFKGIYEYNWNPNAIRWLIVQHSLDVQSKVMKFCDIELQFGNEVLQRSCEVSDKLILNSPKYVTKKLEKVKEVVTPVKIDIEGSANEKSGFSDWANVEKRNGEIRAAEEKLNDQIGEGVGIDNILQRGRLNQVDISELARQHNEELLREDSVKDRFGIEKKNVHAASAERQEKKNIIINSPTIRRRGRFEKVKLEEKTIKDIQDNNQINDFQGDGSMLFLNENSSNVNSKNVVPKTNLNVVSKNEKEIVKDEEMGLTISEILNENSKKIEVDLNDSSPNFQNVVDSFPKNLVSYNKNEQLQKVAEYNRDNLKMTFVDRLNPDQLNIVPPQKKGDIINIKIDELESWKFNKNNVLSGLTDDPDVINAVEGESWDNNSKVEFGRKPVFEKFSSEDENLKSNNELEIDVAAPLLEAVIDNNFKVNQIIPKQKNAMHPINYLDRENRLLNEDIV